MTRVDGSSYATRTIEVGDGPTGIVAAAGAIWVANRGGTISRIDPLQGRVVKTIKTGNAPTGMAAGGGHIWVTVQPP